MQQLEAMRAALDSRVLLLLLNNTTLLASGLDAHTEDLLNKVMLEHCKTRDESSMQHLEVAKNQRQSAQMADQQHADMMHVLNKILLRLPSTSVDHANSVPTSVSPLAYDESRILEWLRFDRMHDRRDTVSETHRKTFEWIFTEKLKTTKLRWTNFTEWLETGSGIYWISGKAGSGKSTLMKFIADELRTKQLPAAWAGRSPLVVASFYFWSSGTTLQRSVEGLLQGLLWEILNVRKDLVRVAYPPNEAPKSVESPPSLPGLKRAFRHSMKHESKQIKYCFTIDGLDEYEGDGMAMTDLAEFFTGLCSQDNVKAIIASRPIQPLASVFEHGALLALHNLTYDDMLLYVRDKVENNARFVQLQAADPIRAQSLVTDIVHKAGGVFLWLALVVRSLLEGLRNHDTVPELERRLCALPADLEKLYGHMLANLPSEYRKKACQLLLLVCAHMTQMPDALLLSFSDLDEQALLSLPMQTMSLATVNRRCEEVRVLVKTNLGVKACWSSSASGR